MHKTKRKSNTLCYNTSAFIQYTRNQFKDRFLFISIRLIISIGCMLCKFLGEWREMKMNWYIRNILIVHLYPTRNFIMSYIFNINNLVKTWIWENEVAVLKNEIPRSFRTSCLADHVNMEFMFARLFMLTLFEIDSSISLYYEYAS